VKVKRAYRFALGQSLARERMLRSHAGAADPRCFARRIRAPDSRSAFALPETTGRRTGLARRTPVGNGLDGDTFWLVAAPVIAIATVVVPVEERTGRSVAFGQPSAWQAADGPGMQRLSQLLRSGVGRWTGARMIRGRRGIALGVIAAAQLMVMLDMTIVNVALPSIQRELHFSAANLTWVIDAYVLVFGGLLLLGGRSGDLFGRRRMFAVGLSLFTAASLAGGLAGSQGMLVAARTVQGVGAAIVAPAALALIATTFAEGRERNRAMSVYAAMTGAGGALGLVLGGLLVEVASWRWVLFVNVPIGAALLALAPLALPRIDGHQGRLDIPGAVTVSAGMSLLVFGLVRAPSRGWGAWTTIAALVLGVVVLAVFLVIERSSKEPLIPHGFLSDRNRSAGYAVFLLVGAAMLSLLFFLTQFLQETLGYSPLLAGVGYLPIPFMVATTSLLLSRRARHINIRLLLGVGPVLIAAGLLLASTLTASSGYLHVFGALVMVGLGMGLSLVPLTLNAVAGVPRHEHGLASSVLNAAQQVGGALGLAVLVTISATASQRYLSAAGHSAAALSAAAVHGFQIPMRFGSAAALAAAVLAVIFLRSARAGEAPPAATAPDASQPSLERSPLGQPPVDGTSAGSRGQPQEA
jgi:EmrB/QacA subfamily drug resistance transporter